MEVGDYGVFDNGERKKPDYQLSNDSFEKDVIYHALKESVDHLKILGGTLPFNSFNWSLVQQDFTHKLHVYTGKSWQLYPKYHEYEMSHLWKMQKERYFLENVLKLTVSELETKDDFAAKHLNAALSDFENIDNFKLLIETRRTDLRQTASELQADIRGLCLKNKEMETFEDDITFEDEIILDETIVCKAKERYVEAWEKARIFQNRMQLTAKEESMKDAIRRQLKYSNLLARANEGMSAFRMSEASKLKIEFERWSERYNKEIEELELELLRINSEKESTENELRALAMKYQEESDGIGEFREFLNKVGYEKRSILEQKDAVSKIKKWWLSYKILKEQLHQSKGHKPKKDNKKKKPRASEENIA